VSLLPAFAAELERGSVLTPDAEAHLDAGHDIQVFVDPRTDLLDKVELDSAVSEQGPDFTAASLFIACNPGTPVPAYLQVP
jgi:hypothetical protein